MTPLPLDKIRFNFRSHLSALFWIALMYRRRPESVQALSQRQSIKAFLRLYAHGLPYLILLSALGRWLLFGALGLGTQWLSKSSGRTDVLDAHKTALVICISVGFISGFVGSFSRNLAGSLAFSLIFGLGLSLTLGLFNGLAAGLTLIFIIGLALGFTITLSAASDHVVLRDGLTLSLGFGLASSVGFGLDIGLMVGLTFGLSYAIAYLRPYYFPIHWLWMWTRGGAYRLHPVAWDDYCLLPFHGLSRLLVSYAEHAPAAGEREIDRLIDEYPSQRQSALRARVILMARQAAAVNDLAKLDDRLAGLPEGGKGFLKETTDLRDRVHKISALQARLDTLSRPFLREPFAALLVKEIETFEAQIAGFKAPLSREFRKAARQWLSVARRQLESTRVAVTREPTRQVFRAGDPVDREREAFVLRDAVLGDLERQVMLAAGCPGLLVYGRRRMGKSTLLRNLAGLLPPRVRVVNLSMQEAGAFTGLPDLVHLIAQRVAAAIPAAIEPSPDLPGLQCFLDSTQKLLEEGDQRLLLSIDEYENLDTKIGEGVLPEDLLAVLRESIQAHRRIIWTFAGSHGIDELVHAPWTSYLVSARTIEVTSFDSAETRLLLTEPLKHSTLWRATEIKRPRFEPGFWGDGGIERIHAEAGGWPHLVQLIAETIVDLVNDSGGADVDGALLARALSKAVVRGNNVLLELMERESRLPGEWDYLRAFRSREEQPIPEDEALDRSLRRRRLVVEEAGRYRLRVPLMARWLRQRI
jgi:energy-coupling factor transporter ATP-binding protein EcfA2